MAKTTALVDIPVADLIPYERNAKRHPEEQLDKLKQSIEEFGFVSPCLVDKDNNIIAGHGRVEAAKALGIESIPCVYIEGLTEEQRRAYILADNRLTELGGWDETLVRAELEQLQSDGFDVSLTGFSIDDYIDDEGGFDALEEDLEKLANIPPSNIYIFAVSAYGVDADHIAVVRMPQETADHFLRVAEEREAADIAEQLLEAVNDL